MSRQFRWEQPSSAAIGEHAWLWHFTPTRRRLIRVIRGIEPLTPTLPGPGRGREQAVWRAERRVVGVVRRATVVSVVVKVVVNAQPGRVGSHADFGCQGVNPIPAD